MIVTKAAPKFMAVTLNVTFETEQELSLFKVMMAMQSTVPDLITYNPAERACLEGMMNKILSKLPA